MTKKQELLKIKAILNREGFQFKLETVDGYDQLFSRETESEWTSEKLEEMTSEMNAEVFYDDKGYVVSI